MNEAEQLCTFTIGDLLFGLEIEHVQEVIRFQEMTRVPLAPERVEGLINLRGQIVTAIDLREQLGLEPRSDDALPMNVVLAPAHGAVSLLVDEIGDVLELAESTFELPPPTLAPELRARIRGVYKLPEKLLLVMDPGKAIEPDCAEIRHD